MTIPSLTSEADIKSLIEADPWMMDVLRAAAEVNLPDWWIGAGFLRNKIWDTIEGKTNELSTDVDLVYFNTENATKEADWELDEKMKQRYPFATWEVRNQARMHDYAGFQPFTSTQDGITHWVETATCIAVKLAGDKLQFLFVYGIDDLLNLTARPTDIFDTPDRITNFRERVRTKKWQDRWPNLTVTSRTE